MTRHVGPRSFATELPNLPLQITQQDTQLCQEEEEVQEEEEASRFPLSPPTTAASTRHPRSGFSRACRFLSGVVPRPSQPGNKGPARISGTRGFVLHQGTARAARVWHAGICQSPTGQIQPADKLPPFEHGRTASKSFKMFNFKAETLTEKDKFHLQTSIIFKFSSICIHGYL